jgi:hypothetical protein
MAGWRAVAGADVKADANDARSACACAETAPRGRRCRGACQRVAISSTFGPSWPVDWILTEFDVPLASGVDMVICW